MNDFIATTSALGMPVCALPSATTSRLRGRSFAGTAATAATALTAAKHDSDDVTGSPPRGAPV